MDLKKYASKIESGDSNRKCPSCDRVFLNCIIVDVRITNRKMKPVRFCAACFVRIYQEENQCEK